MKRLKFLLFTACVLLLFTLALTSCGECVHNYDSEGNVLDEYILDSTIYRLSNVTVGKIAE